MNASQLWNPYSLVTLSALCSVLLVFNSIQVEVEHRPTCTEWSTFRMFCHSGAHIFKKNEYPVLDIYKRTIVMDMQYSIILCLHVRIQVQLWTRFFFCCWWGGGGSKYHHYKWAIINGPPNGVSMSCQWWPNIAGLVAVWFFRRFGPVLLRNPIYLWFFRGGGVWSPVPLCICAWSNWSVLYLY